MVLRRRAHARIGVRAAGRTNQRAKRKKKRSRGKSSTSINKPYELTLPTDIGPPHLTSYIGLDVHSLTLRCLRALQRGHGDPLHPRQCVGGLHRCFPRVSVGFTAARKVDPSHKSV